MIELIDYEQYKFMYMKHGVRNREKVKDTLYNEIRKKIDVCTWWRSAKLRKVLEVICFHASGKGFCSATLENIAKEAGCSLSRVEKCVQLLLDLSLCIRTNLRTTKHNGKGTPVLFFIGHPMFQFWLNYFGVNYGQDYGTDNTEISSHDKDNDDNDPPQPNINKNIIYIDNDDTVNYVSNSASKKEKTTFGELIKLGIEQFSLTLDMDQIVDYAGRAIRNATKSTKDYFLTACRNLQQKIRAKQFLKEEKRKQLREKLLGEEGKMTQPSKEKKMMMTKPPKQMNHNSQGTNEQRLDFMQRLGELERNGVDTTNIDTSKSIGNYLSRLQNGRFIGSFKGILAFHRS